MTDARRAHAIANGKSAAHHPDTRGVIGSYLTEIIKSTRRRAKHIEVHITMDDLAEVWEHQEGRCALTGWDLTLKAYRSDTSSTASLDRIDSNGHYSRDNIQWVHKDVNRVKGYFPEQELFTICQAIYTHKERTKALRSKGQYKPWLTGS